MATRNNGATKSGPAKSPAKKPAPANAPAPAPGGADPFRRRDPSSAAAEAEPLVHVIRKGVRCATERRGYATPENRSPFKIVVDASNGFIPLWASNVTLHWRFQERSMRYFRNPEAAKAAIENLFGEALLQWGDAMPVRFARREDNWDFEIVMSGTDDCDGSGCVLASAFFPDAGRHELWMYPKMFTQARQEIVETLIHEIGHVFGLRHFFAQVSEGRWPSEIFGSHRPFSIMNYGAQSVLTETDRRDLRRLYRAAWGGALTHINGTPIRLVRPYHEGGEPAGMLTGLAAAAAMPVVLPAQPRAAYATAMPGTRRAAEISEALCDGTPDDDVPLSMPRPD